MASIAHLVFGCPAANQRGEYGLLCRNDLPWGWAALFRPEDVRPFPLPGDEEEEEEARMSFIAVAETGEVRRRAGEHAAKRDHDPRWAPFALLASRLEGIGGLAVLDPIEIDRMGDPGELEARFRQSSRTLVEGGVDYGAWSSYLDADVAAARVRARRASGCAASDEAFAALCIGAPESAWAARWEGAWPGLGEPALRSSADEGEALLAGLEARGILEVLRRPLTVRMLGTPARFRSVDALQEVLGICVAMGALRTTRDGATRVLDRIVKPGQPDEVPLFDEAVLTELIAGLGD